MRMASWSERVPLGATLQQQGRRWPPMPASHGMLLQGLPMMLAHLCWNVSGVAEKARIAQGLLCQQSRGESTPKDLIWHVLRSVSCCRQQLSWASALLCMPQHPYGKYFSLLLFLGAKSGLGSWTAYLHYASCTRFEGARVF